MADTPADPPPPRPSARKIYTYGILGFTLFPVLLLIVGFVLGGMISRRGHPTTWDDVKYPWAVLGGAVAAAPVLLSTKRYPEVPGSRARVWGVILGVLAFIVSGVFAWFGFVFSGIPA